MHTLLKKLVLLFTFAVAAQSVTAQRAIVVADTTVLHGETGCVAVALQSLGDENAVSFSLCFDTNLLTYVSATRGTDAAGSTFFLNTGQAASGRVGILVGLGPDEVFSAGSNHIAQVCFRIKAGIPGTNTMIAICDDPLGREIADVNAETLSAAFANGTVSIGGICTYSLLDDNAEISSAGGNASVSILTGTTCPWGVVNTNAWISFPATNGTGSGPIQYIVEPNPIATARTGAVMIAGQRLTVIQVAAPCSFELSPTSRVHDHMSTFNTFDVITFDNCDWVVINTNSWILIKLFTNGTGSGFVRYTVLANSDPHPRTGNIVVGGLPFTVFQFAAPCTYNLLPTNRLVSASGANGQLSIFTPTDCPWTAVNTNQWITLTGPQAGSGNAVFEYVVAPRFGTNERTGRITVGGKQFVVTQLGTTCAYTISPTSRSHGSGRTTNTITVNTNLIEECARLMWTATTTNPWIRILGGSSGFGRGTVRYAVTNHTQGGTRIGSILVADRLFTITQSGLACNYSRTPSSRSHAYLAETGAVTVSATPGCTWTPTVNQPWVTITSLPGNGNGVVTYRLATNNGSSSRSATITIAGMSFSVSQNTATAVSISSQPANVSILGGGTAVFNVTASGTAPLSYQWRLNGVNLVDNVDITGATTPRLTLTNVRPEQAGNYTVVVSNVRGPVTSSTATLRVNTSPVMPEIPPKIVNRGTLLSFRPVVIDVDIPPQTMTWSLLAAPSGLTINSSSGLITWTPATTQPIGTNLVRIRVVDNGSPALSATQNVTIMVISAPTTNVTLINTGAVWTFRDTGENLNTVWTSPLFDDGLWRTGPAPLGYGTTPLRTTVGFGPNSSAKYITTYFRQRFFLTEPESYSSLTIRIRRDDGVVLYLNGTEIYRNNMPAGPIGHLTAASASASDSASYVTSPVDAGALVAGQNVLAAEIHQSSGGSSDIVFDLGLSGIKTFTAPSITTHPLTQTQPEGGAAQLTVAASGMLPLNYQWYFDGEPIPGATNNILALSDLELTHTGDYFAMINNTSGAATSSVARLTVFKVINLPPELAAIADRTVAEGNLLTFTATATDPNLPNQRLTYSLGPGAPTGASIHADTGVFRWTPDELDGGQTFSVTVRVEDNGDPPAGDFASFNINVFDTNNAPVLAAIGNKSGMENVLLTFTASATDSDVPAQALTFSLGTAPAGASINPTNGVFTWTPTEAQAPSTNTVVIIVSDDGTPPRTDSESITIVVTGFNTAPVLAPIATKVVRAGELLTFTALGNDSDLPPQTLRFSLAPGFPAGVTLNATNGVFNWTPTATQAGGTNNITIRVADNGSPPMSNSQTFAVWVLPGTQTNLTLIPIESVWRYRDTGENLNTAWRERTFNDTAWASGAGTLGYGGSYIITTVNQGPTTARFITTYFRRAFTVGNPGSLSPLQMRIRRDDGVVVYLNGVEVHRDNMPTGAINYQTLAPINMDAEDELTYFPAPPIPSNLLVPGTNVLAVELHQKSTGSSDTSFDLELTTTITVMPPTIIAHPQSDSILEGQNASFSVTAVGNAPLRYQWRFNNSPVAGGTNTTLTIPAAQLSAAGNYTVVVTNASGSATSQVATLAVERVTGISFVAPDATALSGQEVLVPMRVTGFSNISSFQFSLQWNPAVAALIGIEPLALSNVVFGLVETNLGVMPISWDDPNGLSTSLPGGTNLFTLRFRLVGTPGTTTALSITNSPATIEVANNNLEMVPVSVGHGTITVAIPAGSSPPEEIVAQPVMGISMEGDSVSIWWSAVPGKRYRLEACDDHSFNTWFMLGEITAGSETAMAMDAGPLFGMRLYRVVILE